MDSSKPIIRIKNVDYQYSESHRVILSKINLEVHKGEFIVISGKSGSGKSTLALVLSGFIPHLFAGKFTGEIEYQGLKTEELSLGEISQFVGLVQQNPENQIVTSTVVEEITFGPGNLNLDREELSNRLSYSLTATNKKNIANRSTTALSGGEKQKVVLASILSMGSSVLVLDEPFSFLDHKTRNLFLATLKELTEQQGKTIIVIDHQPEIYQSLMTRLIVLADGTIKEDLPKATIDYSVYTVPQKILMDIKGLSHHQLNKNILKIRNLSVAFKKEQILKDINLSIDSGLIYGVIGPNGSGKTTLAQTIMNLYPYNGNIRFLDNEISKIPTHRLAKEIGYIWQNPDHQIFEDTVVKEITFAPKNILPATPEILNLANQMLEDASLESYVDFPPFGLSYGEKRRLTICSSEIYSPSVLILDEPFIGQDRQNFEYVLEILRLRKQKGLTSIVISHRKELYDLVDHMFVIDSGYLIKQGSPLNINSFFEEQEEYSNYLGG
ncbi:MAG: ABC transporter ATP-binding protein [Candidatus Hodarchaeales archaeon]